MHKIIFFLLILLGNVCVAYGTDVESSPIVKLSIAPNNSGYGSVLYESRKFENQAIKTQPGYWSAGESGNAVVHTERKIGVTTYYFVGKELRDNLRLWIEVEFNKDKKPQIR